MRSGADSPVPGARSGAESLLPGAWSGAESLVPGEGPVWVVAAGLVIL